MTPLEQDEEFKDYSFLELNEDGQFLDRKKVVPAHQLKRYFDSKIRIRPTTTDVFVWVHGWRNKRKDAIGNSQTLFPAIKSLYEREAKLYPRLAGFQPQFISVHWPSHSSVFPSGYRRIRDRAAYMTREGEAEYLLAELLGYLNEHNEEAPRDKRKLLASRDGFFVHCVGHSFGGRFLTAAVCAAHNPTPRTKKLSEDKPKFKYTIDSFLVFQMAAPAWTFSDELEMLATDAPIADGNGRIVLTHSDADTANCTWHSVTEGEQAIGCKGLIEPKSLVGRCEFKKLSDDNPKYLAKDFKKRIVNINANDAFNSGSGMQGSHSDFWYEDSIHLILTLADRARS